MQAGNVNQCPTTEYVNHRARRTDAEPITYGSIPMVIGFAFEKSWLSQEGAAALGNQSRRFFSFWRHIGGCRHAIMDR